jgi:hypothetical protein
MTTREAAATYLAEHQREWFGRPFAVFNPKGAPVESLPVIFGFNNGGRAGWMLAQLIAEDGEPMGSHVCSDEGYMPSDLGCLEGSRSDRHEGFQKKYPNGYRMEFVSETAFASHEGLQAAFKTSELSLDPQHVTNDLWFYEERSGLRIIHAGQQIVIPWGMIENSMRRYRKAKAQ